ncbi:DotU family type IV/VI secretion system protein [Silvanigrella aquatica]|uniref:Type IV / VI secretion system DotU domain-containing protein n=1 Tax=Silvanigrella aquatica TaxID=1915309 RepID=A0A1L4CZ19_9BACT|nr:DotU family type IV/VI secretion system protein [Silvanigrella aquatica]APJ03199.1 hypothetical protein AXG55_04490 [Silvanigrella aquatica]
MTSNKHNDGSHHENIIFITEEIINYFFDIRNKLILKNIENSSENELIYQIDDVKNLSKDIEELISRKMDILKKYKKYYGTEIIRLLHYALVSLIDEMLITTQWQGRMHWTSDTLENRIFGSRSSGDLFFENCSQILLERDYKYRDLSLSYYFCLCSGFRGKYHSYHDVDKIQQIKSELYQFYYETNFESTPEISGLIPNNLIISNHNEYEMYHKKVIYSLLFSNFFLFAFFLMTSIIMWIINSNILSKNLM